MAFLNIDGLEVPVLVDEFELRDASVETYGRNADDSLQGSTYSVKREMSFVTEPMTVANARALEGWVRGRRHQWTFDRLDGATTRFTRYSDEGGLLLASAGTLTGNSPTFGTWSLVLSTSAVTACATATFGSEGDWSVSVQHKLTAATQFFSYTTRSRAGVIDSLFNNAAYGTVGFLNITAVSGFLQVILSGRNDGNGTAAGSSATSVFENLKIYPYALTDAMDLTFLGGGISTGLSSPAPFVKVTGDCLLEANVSGASGPGPVICKGFVESIPTEPLVVDTFDYDARQLRVKLVQR